MLGEVLGQELHEGGGGVIYNMPLVKVRGGDTPSTRGEWSCSRVATQTRRMRSVLHDDSGKCKCSSTRMHRCERART
jgi:hypothetical protein